MNTPLHDVLFERKRQDNKWGEQNHIDLYWMGILIEELGETSKAMIENNLADMRKELVEVCAVALAWLEAISRREAGKE